MSHLINTRMITDHSLLRKHPELYFVPFPVRYGKSLYFAEHLWEWISSAAIHSIIPFGAITYQNHFAGTHIDFDFLAY